MVITLDGDASVSCTAAGLPDGLYFALHLIVICSPIRERSSVAVVPSADIFISRSSAVIAEKYPELCQLTDDDEQGGLRFEIDKSRISIRLTAPYTDDRRRAASELAKKRGIHTESISEAEIFRMSESIGV